MKKKKSKNSRKTDAAADTTFQRSQSKIWKNLSVKSKSIEEHMVWISIAFTFYLLES